MQTIEKILKAVKTSKTYVENLKSALSKQDENLLHDGVWHAAAELEYALFLLSITLQGEDDIPKPKLNPDIKKDLSSVLADVHVLLDETEKFLEAKKMLDSYKSAYVARHYLLKVQEDLAKKRRELSKGKG
ncbi:MAG: hypothetical protein QW667_03715 [Candidatus Bathyarchaeia archaeon]